MLVLARSGLKEREEQFMKLAWRFLQDESGPSAVEYAVMLALIIGTCIAAIGLFGTTSSRGWQDTSDKLQSTMGN